MNAEECSVRRSAVLEAVSKLYEKLERPLTIQEVADEAGVSRSATHRYIVWLWSNRQVDRTQDEKNGSIVPAGIGARW